MVREPRKVLAEMGLELPATTAIRVWDSSAEIRYMVVPERPAGTERERTVKSVEVRHALTDQPGRRETNVERSSAREGSSRCRETG